jgi:GR25 family glycosyltransferase involved in LPS biosynthesis
MLAEIDHVFYINLDHRFDRRDEIESELNKIGLLERSERLSAFYTPNNGHLGCTRSHLEAVRLAKARGYKNILILEDDFTFIVKRETFEILLNQFFKTFNEDYDAMLLAYSDVTLQHNMESSDNDFFKRTTNTQTASGYILNQRVFDSFIELLEHAVRQLEDLKENHIYAIDQIWKVLQRSGKWYVSLPKIGKQRPSYSDTEGRHVVPVHY